MHNYLNDRDVVGPHSDDLHKGGAERGAGLSSAEEQLAVGRTLGVVQEPHAVVGDPGRLEEGGEEGGVLGQLGELGIIVVVEDDVDGEGLLEGVGVEAGEGGG